jgi:predicted ATPase
MLTRLTLKNFKCFENQFFDFKQLTMLTGLNSTGKSTVLQAMLLLRQSHEDRVLHNVGLTLDGPLVQLGTARDVLYEAAKDESISIGLDWDDAVSATFKFGSDQTADVLTLISGSDSTAYASESLFTDMFHYLEAERIGPRSAFDMSEFEVHRHRQLGTGGEYAAHFMASFGEELQVQDDMHHPNAQTHSLRDEVEAWMSEISPGIRFHFNPHRSMDLVNVEISFSSAGSVNTNEYRPVNVGFGITYTLPIVISLLASGSGTLIFLENPEAHLHPRGQSKIGELIARAAASGVQVIFETHSDHVLNGIRIAVKGRLLQSSDAVIYFFDKYSVVEQADQEPRVKARVTQLSMDSNGRIDEWPSGFFDEFEKSIEKLL